MMTILAAVPNSGQKVMFAHATGDAVTKVQRLFNFC